MSRRLRARLRHPGLPEQEPKAEGSTEMNEALRGQEGSIRWGREALVNLEEMCQILGLGSGTPLTFVLHLICDLLWPWGSNSYDANRM